MGITSNNKKKILVRGISLKSNIPNLYYTVNNQSTVKEKETTRTD